MAIPNKQVKSNTDILDNRRTQTRIKVHIHKDLHGGTSHFTTGFSLWGNSHYC